MSRGWRRTGGWDDRSIVWINWDGSVYLGFTDTTRRLRKSDCVFLDRWIFGLGDCVLARLSQDTDSMTGRMSRQKGKRFERTVAALFRAAGFQQEVWKPVLGFDGYEVSDQGRLRSYRMRGKGYRSRKITPKIMVPKSDRYGYHQVNLRRDLKAFHPKVHTLVLEAFVGQRPLGMVCCHKNGQRADNRLQNLRWGTPQSNRDDMELHGTVQRGSLNPHAILTESDVLTIRRDPRSSTELAKIYGVDRSTIKCARRRKTWAWL